MADDDPLDDKAIERYARQVVIPAIGAEGQRRLLRARVLVAGHPRGAGQAALYLKASGVTVPNGVDGESPDVVLVAQAATLEEPTRRRILAMGVPVCWYQLEEHGYRSGVHPASPLPDHAPDAGWNALHDAAACDTAALACAVLLNLPHRPARFRFDRDAEPGG